MMHRDDLSTTLTPLPGTHRYRVTISNTSNLGAINSFQWYPPTGVHIVKVVGSTEGRCTLTGLKGFGGNQFPTVVLYPNVFCDKLDLEGPELHLPRRRRRRDDLVRHRQGLRGGSGDLRVRAATLVLRPHPRLPQAREHAEEPRVRHAHR